MAGAHTARTRVISGTGAAAASTRGRVRGTWSPGSRYVAVPTADGAAVVDAARLRVLDPLPADAEGGRVWPTVAFASPDGSRLLLLARPAARSGGLGVMVDPATGRRVAVTGTDTSTSVAWDRCDSVWRVALPLGGVLALVGAVWLAVGLRRSRRRGERFLPMILNRSF